MITIRIDTREQTPWHFPQEMASVVRGKIDSGDYALDGDQDNFAIERKSLDDFVGTISSGWERFLRELDRMKIFPARVIIVESGYDRILSNDHNHYRVGPGFVCRKMAELTLSGISVLLCDNATAAAGMCWRILKMREDVINGRIDCNC